MPSCSGLLFGVVKGYAGWTGGYAGLDRIEDWNLDFMERSEKGQEYLATARQVEQAIRFMVACGMTVDVPIMRETDFFVSHECLLLDYEQALTRQDSTTGGWCAFASL